jgi:hypothetical protein
VSRGVRKWTEEAVTRLKAEGRGTGTGATYKPWILATELSSLGRARRVYSPKTGREHHLLSDVEYHVFLLLEWAQDVVDIREQYPLDRDLTLEIAGGLQIRHPYYPGTQVATVMTVDLLATRLKDGERALEAFNVKTATEAETSDSTLQKLEIARSYFEGLGVAHHLVLDTHLPLQKVRNIEWIRGGALRTDELEAYAGQWDELMHRMTGQLRHAEPSQALNRFCESFDNQLGLEQGIGLRVARMLMQSRVLMPDLSAPNLASAPLMAFQVAALPGSLVAVGGA